MLRKAKSFFVIGVIWSLFLMLVVLLIRYRSVSTSPHGRPMPIAAPIQQRACPNVTVPLNTSYVLALGLKEQLSQASRSMLLMAPVAADWSAQLVEPVVVRSHIFGIEGILTRSTSKDIGEPSLKLSEIYDISRVNRMLQYKASPPVRMASFEEFLATASRRVTVLHFVTSALRKDDSDFVLDRTEAKLVMKHYKKKTNVNSTPLFDCTHLLGATKWAHIIERQLNHLVKSDRVCELFAVQKVLCFDPTKVFQSENILQHMSQPGTMIFTEWRGCGFDDYNCSIHHKENSKVHKNPSIFRPSVLTKASMGELPIESMQTLHNPTIRKVAKKYLEAINIKSPFLSIHIRNEWLWRDKKDVMCCLDVLMEVVDDIKKTHNLSETLLLTDVSSEYGTDACNRQCVLSLIQSLSTLKLPVTSYNPKVLNGTENSAYVSLVEMNMLSMGDKLVLVGHSGFQTILKEIFLSLNHTAKEVYDNICAQATSCPMQKSPLLLLVCFIVVFFIILSVYLYACTSRGNQRL